MRRAALPDVARCARPALLALVVLSGCRDGVAPYVAQTREPFTEPVRRMTFSGFQDLAPSWSLDSDTIHYSTNRFYDFPLRAPTLLALAIDGGISQRLVPSAQTDSTSTTKIVIPALARPLLSPDGKRLAYYELVCGCAGCVITSTCIDGRYFGATLRVRDADAIKQADFDPAVQVPIQGDFDGFEHAFAWSPDGTRIAFGDGAQVSVWTIGQSAGVPIPNTVGGDSPTWSPDGNRIAFSRAGQIQTVSLDGTVDSLTAGADPVYSHDGAYIYFVANKKIERISVNGGQPLTVHDTDNGRSPSPSPDGRWLAFIRPQSTDGNWDIYIVALDGAE